MSDSDLRQLYLLAFALLLLWGYLSGGFVGRPELRRTLRGLWAALGVPIVRIARRVVPIGLLLVVSFGALYIFIRFVKWAWAD